MSNASKASAKRIVTIAVLSAALFAAGCEPARKNHGYAPRPDEIAKVRIGEDDKQSVLKKLGPPATASAFDGSAWYYISQVAEQTKFGGEAVTDQRVVAVSFDESGKAAAIDQYGLEDGEVIDLVTRTTPTRGRRLTFLQQLLGNIGRFSSTQGLRNGL